MGEVVRLRARNPVASAVTESIESVCSSLEAVAACGCSDLISNDPTVVAAVLRLTKSTNTLRRKLGITPEFPEFQR